MVYLDIEKISNIFQLFMLLNSLYLVNCTYWVLYSKNTTRTASYYMLKRLQH